MNFLILNGPNLNLLGIREPEIYGSTPYAALERMLYDACAAAGDTCRVFQTNHEGVLVDEIQAALGVYDGIVINPAAYTHTSIAIPDAIRAVGVPTAEVHLSDIRTREEYRRVSLTSPACICTVMGKGVDGYREALDALRAYLHTQRNQGGTRL